MKAAVATQPHFILSSEKPVGLAANGFPLSQRPMKIEGRKADKVFCPNSPQCLIPPFCLMPPFVEGFDITAGLEWRDWTSWRD